MKKIISNLLFIIFLSCSVFGQDSTTIKVYFLYGSRPCKGYIKEKKLFGGIHGGHVSIGIGSIIGGFTQYNRFHIFSHKKKLHSIFLIKNKNQFLFDTIGRRYATFDIPLADSQFVKIKNIFDDYIAQTPYDYAFFGMRCASAAYDILSQIGILKQRTRFGNIISNFYPKKLRKKLFKIAKENHYKIAMTKGRLSRKWEND